MLLLIKILPETLQVFGSKFKQAKESNDFPQPDGPTRASREFFLIEKETLSKTFFLKPELLKEIERFLTSKTMFFFKIKKINLKPR